MVRMTGLEPARLSAYASKAYVAAVTPHPHESGETSDRHTSYLIAEVAGIESS